MSLFSFVLNFLIWLFIGAVLYGIFRRIIKGSGSDPKTPSEPPRQWTEDDLP